MHTVSINQAATNNASIAYTNAIVKKEAATIIAMFIAIIACVVLAVNI